MQNYFPYIPKGPSFPKPAYDESGKSTHVYRVPVDELRRALAFIDAKEKQK